MGSDIFDQPFPDDAASLPLGHSTCCPHDDKGPVLIHIFLDGDVSHIETFLTIPDASNDES